MTYPNIQAIHERILQSLPRRLKRYEEPIVLFEESELMDKVEIVKIGKKRVVLGCSGFGESELSHDEFKDELYNYIRCDQFEKLIQSEMDHTETKHWNKLARMYMENLPYEHFWKNNETINYHLQAIRLVLYNLTDGEKSALDALDKVDEEPVMTLGDLMREYIDN